MDIEGEAKQFVPSKQLEDDDDDDDDDADDITIYEFFTPV